MDSQNGTFLACRIEGIDEMNVSGKPVIISACNPPGAAMAGVERREWSLWVASVLVALLLTAAIASFLLSPELNASEWLATMSLGQAVRGLLSLVIIFYFYAVYEQLQLNAIRRQFTEKVYHLSVEDSLTGLSNRRHIEERLVEEMGRAQRNNHPLTIILFDLNSFKQVNDSHGHTCGDSVLRGFAERLQRATRGSDVAGRYGGDEFLIVLPECTLKAVDHVLERLDKVEIEAGGRLLTVSYSVGWAQYIPGEAAREFLERADSALYTHKRDQHRVSAR